MIKMIKYVKETPDILISILENNERMLSVVNQYLHKTTIQRIYIVGSGTSCHAGISAKKFLEHILKVQVTPLFPNEFINEITEDGPQTLFIGISQSGASVSTINALKEAKARGDMCITVVGEKNTDVEEVGDVNVFMDCGIETSSAKTKGYEATVLTLFLLGLSYGFQNEYFSIDVYHNYIRNIRRMIINLQSVIDESILWAKDTAVELLDKKSFRVIGDQNCMGTVMEGTLKLLETVRVGVSGYELEEFMHGGYNAIDKSSVLLIIENTQDQYYKRQLKLVNYLATKTDYQYSVSSDKNQNVRSLVLPFINDLYFSALEYIIPFQCLAYYISTEKGINPDIASDPEFHMKMGSKNLKK
ncbi:SIS domain-containing protein [Pediococcus ethanolidurans]|uniref:Phosphosugar isomerase n=1 Tax=Pediococcus ethanolidurans TaxID=319653 RepID=A0A0R2K8T0_9LACO|nr:SIS domain-containing protein [Pediococcus ethanolidurans]KRN83628.1 phosphosugar isomerase [Pediococcus ethanolidurans]GEN94017.1 phosphosugar isomerase [Pediococcus ethanolidurans]SER02015.1 SIS domain-containing protein [Pediococcus ethanolidurans]